ncbi:MAG: hypothetical protein MI975_11785 [Cytophagales bacterium]|nr:hypothetical protein [Cytophagales bacterium]
MRNLSIAFCTVIIAAFLGCDKLENDVVPDIDHPENLKNEVFTTQNTSVVFDFKNQRNFSEQSRISIASPPQKGKLNLLADGYANYIPKPDFEKGSDLIVFKTDHNSQSKFELDSVKIIMVEDTTDLPCHNGALSDYVTTRPSSAIRINVLANDAVCDVSEVDVKILQPTKGGTLVPVGDAEPFIFEYKPNADFIGSDTALYQLRLQLSADDIYESVALIVIKVEECAKLQVVDDRLYFDKDTLRNITIYPLLNDSMCIDEEYTFEVVEGPAEGTIKYDAKVQDYNFSIDYKAPNKTTEVHDSIKYRLISALGVSNVATIRISFMNNPVNPTCTVNTMDDFYHFYGDTSLVVQSDSIIFSLDVLSNDQIYCDDLSNLQLAVLDAGKYGKVYVEDRLIMYKFPESLKSIQKDSLQYQACIGAECDSSFVIIKYE